MEWITKVFLKIRNTIVKLFNKRKMEIDKTINRWFEETSTQIDNQVNTATKVDLLLVSSLIAARNYSNAVFLLLRNGHKMSAKALLRILCELVVKVLWCFLIPDNLEGSREEFITQKIRRWTKATLKLNAKIIQEIKGAVANGEKSKLNDIANCLLNDANSIEVKEMPNVKQIFGQLPEPWRGKIRAIGYLQFNNAIHPDPKSLGDLIERNGDVLTYPHDSKDDINELSMYNVSYAFNFNTIVRWNYKWDIKQMNKEYQAVISKLSERKV